MAQNEWSQARLQTALENFLLGGALAPLTVRQLKIIRTKPSKRMVQKVDISIDNFWFE